MKVQEIMCRDVKVCTRDDTLNTAAKLMWDNDCGCVPVIAADGRGVVVGMLTDRDICMAALTQSKALYEILVPTAMSRQVFACKADDDVKQVEALMREHEIRRMPVVDDNGILRGIISLNDIAREAQRERSRVGVKREVSDSEVAETLAGVCHPRAELRSTAL